MRRPRSARRRIERALFPMLVRRCVRAVARQDDHDAASLEDTMKVLQAVWHAQVGDLVLPEQIDVLRRMSRLEVALVDPMVKREVTLPFYAIHKLMQKLIDEDAFDPSFDQDFRRAYSRLCHAILDEPDNIASLEEHEAEAEAHAGRMLGVLRKAGLFAERWRS